jgi:tetratricopeptide (TPR) repeat protein
MPTFLGSLFVDTPPERLATWLDDRLDEPIWGLVETGSDRDEGDVWLVVTATRNALAAAGKKGRWWKDLPAAGELTIDTKLTRRVFSLDDSELFTCGRLGGGDLLRLAELAFVPRGDGLYDAALDHVKRKRWEEADALLQACEDALSEEDRAPSVAYLNREQEIVLQRAQCAMELGREGEAVARLAGLAEQRPGDDLLEVTGPMHDVEGWLLTLALAHEEAGHHAEAAAVYQRLIDEKPDQDLFVRSWARALRRSGDHEAAADAYDRFIEGRATDDLSLVVRDSADADLLDADPDLVVACLESGALFEERGLPAKAAERYITLIRHAPFAREGYARLFKLADSLDDDALSPAAEVLRLLQPEMAASVAGLPPRHQPAELPREYGRLDDEDHDQRIVHPGERVSSRIAQKWLGALLHGERDTSDIERHARKVDGSKYPQVLAVVRSVSAMLGVEPPRLFLSFGSSGVDVLGDDDPIVLLGACHLDAHDERHLDLRHLTFALATQIEHIRAGHLILTSSELWKTLGMTSATALLAFVPMGDFIGRLTDTSVLKWMSKFKGTTETKVTRKLLEVAEARVKEGATRDGVQSAYTAALAKVRQLGLRDEEEEQPTMVKERLADFARCALYTADRVGLLACDDLAVAVDAIVRMSPTYSSYATRLDDEGLVPLLTEVDEDGKPRNEELALRIGELFKFALSEDYGRLRDLVLSEGSKSRQMT